MRTSKCDWRPRSVFFVVDDEVDPGGGSGDVEVFYRFAVIGAVCGHGEPAEAEGLLSSDELSGVAGERAGVVAADDCDKRGKEVVLAWVVPNHHGRFEFVGHNIGFRPVSVVVSLATVPASPRVRVSAGAGAAGAVARTRDVGFGRVDADVAAVFLPDVTHPCSSPL